MEFLSSLPAAFQTIASPAPTGGGIEIPRLLLPTASFPLPLAAAVPSPSGGLDARGVEGSVLAAMAVNQAASTAGGNTIVLTLDRGVYRLDCNFYTYQSGFTLSAAAPYLVRLGLLTPDGSAFGTLAFDAGSTYTDHFNVTVSLQTRGWRVAIATESTGVGQTLGAVASVLASRLL